MNNEKVSIILPTWNNTQYLQGAITSLIKNATTENLFHVYVINNGHKDSCDWIQTPYVTVLQTGGKNLGWEGGLKLGLKASKAPFVCFFNDDAYIPHHSRLWLNHLLQHFRDEKVGAVGPSSNVVMGMQNIFAQLDYTIFPTRFLIGFCMLVRRSALKAAGGIDDTLPGGDDLDLSIRLRDKGYELIVDRDVFVYHHGFKTGERLHGTADKPGGWNSVEMTDRTNNALIKKHGFRKWWECLKGVYEFDERFMTTGSNNEPESEGVKIRNIAKGKVILDLGCGANKTLPDAIGVDMIKKDDFIDSLGKGQKSQADIQADVTQPLPIADNTIDCIIARHILEHMIDPLQVIKQWVKVIKPGGQLIIAVPNGSFLNTIPMNVEHVHSFTPQSLRTILEAAGLTVTQQMDSENGVSFITEAIK